MTPDASLDAGLDMRDAARALPGRGAPASVSASLAAESEAYAMAFELALAWALP